MANSTEDPKENILVTAADSTDNNQEFSAPPDSVLDKNAADAPPPPEDSSNEDGASVKKKEPLETEEHEDLANGDIVKKSIPEMNADFTQSDDTPSTVESDRTEEIPALLDRPSSVDSGEPEKAESATLETIRTEAEPEKTVAVTEPVNILSEPPATPVKPEIPAAEHPANAIDVTVIMESLQDSLTNTRYISSKIDAVFNDTDCLIKQVNGLSSKYDLLTSEMELTSSRANTKNVLSKTFLISSSLLVALLFISQIYIFISQIKMQHLQDKTGSAVLGNISSLNKKMAVYDKNLTKTLEPPAQQEHAQSNPVFAEKTGHGTTGHTETVPANVTPVLEKLNKLRNGLPEKKLIRKETGDWFVFNKKSEECISDLDIIEALNQAYKKIGRPLTPKIPMPAHNALCVLKPDGHGGTEIVMTKNFLP